MPNQFGRDQYRSPRPERDREDDRSFGQYRNDRDEDGGWEREHGSGASRHDQRGYGRVAFGESGLGEPNRGEGWGQGSNRYQQESSSSGRGESGYGSSAGQYGSYGGSSGQYGGSGGYGGSAGQYGGASGYGGSSGQYGVSGGYGSSGQYGGSSGYGSSWGRGSYGSQRDQGFRNRDFGGESGYAGRGPKDYKRTDERIREDVCDRLSQDDEVDASEISVRVESGEVTLEGSTETRRQKHRAEEIAADVFGVSDVHNNVRVRKSMLTELKDKVTGHDEPSGGHAGSGTKTTGQL